MQKTLALPEKGNTKASAPGSKAWSWLINKSVLVRLKSGVTISGRCVRVSCNIITLGSPLSIWERDAAPVAVQNPDGEDELSLPSASLHIDGGGVSFIVEAAHRD